MLNELHNPLLLANLSGLPETSNTDTGMQLFQAIYRCYSPAKLNDNLAGWKLLGLCSITILEWVCLMPSNMLNHMSSRSGLHVIVGETNVRHM